MAAYSINRLFPVIILVPLHFNRKIDDTKSTGEFKDQRLK